MFDTVIANIHDIVETGEAFLGFPIWAVVILIFVVIGLIAMVPLLKARISIEHRVRHGQEAEIIQDIKADSVAEDTNHFIAMNEGLDEVLQDEQLEDAELPSTGTSAQQSCPAVDAIKSTAPAAKREMSSPPVMVDDPRPDAPPSSKIAVSSLMQSSTHGDAQSLDVGSSPSLVSDSSDGNNSRKGLSGRNRKYARPRSSSPGYIVLTDD